jgi:excisionase family DNA binding protein
MTPERPPDPQTVRLYSVPDAAYLLGVSERYVWELIREGVLARVRMGHRTLVRDDELAALIERNTERGLG